MNRKDRISNYQAEIIQALEELVSYNSVHANALKQAPFGQANADCLDAALRLCERYGLRPVNLDHYIGYGEIGVGDDVIGILGHLDIVPAGEGWKTDPFELTHIDNRLYGRGTSDDKGAVIAALFALKILQDEGFVFNKRVRLIMGSNEETGSLCLAHYVEKEGHFNYGFTPDAMFPGVFGEKGSIGGTFESNQTKILNIQGGLAPNVVCNRCITSVPLDVIDLERFSAFLDMHEIDHVIERKDDCLVLDVRGISAHASLPELGKNAIAYTMAALHAAGFDDPFVEFYHAMFNLTTDGSACGIATADEYGALTFNNGVIRMENGTIIGTIDIRTPLTMDSQTIAERMRKGFGEHANILHIDHIGKSLFYPQESPLVESLLDAYRDVTQDYEREPLTMGGGTYAKGVDNCIAFGCAFPNEDNHIHDANEFVDLDQLLLQVEIYAKAIEKLCWL